MVIISVILSSDHHLFFIFAQICVELLCDNDNGVSYSNNNRYFTKYSIPGTGLNCWTSLNKYFPVMYLKSILSSYQLFSQLIDLSGMSRVKWTFRQLFGIAAWRWQLLLFRFNWILKFEIHHICIDDRVQQGSWTSLKLALYVFNLLATTMLHHLTVNCVSGSNGKLAKRSENVRLVTGDRFVQYQSFVFRNLHILST